MSEKTMIMVTNIEWTDKYMNLRTSDSMVYPILPGSQAYNYIAGRKYKGPIIEVTFTTMNKRKYISTIEE